MDKCKDKNCPRNKICNPKTGRCVLKSGRIGKKLNKSKSRRIRRKSKSKSKAKSRSRKKLSKGCVERSNFPLRQHQKKVVNYLDKNDGIIVIHGTGTGKTLTAVTASQCFLDKNPGKKVIVVSPAALIHNFSKELENYANYKHFSRYEFYSFSKFLNKFYKNGLRDGPPSNKLCGKSNPLEKYRSVNLSGNMLIVDEAHNLRNMSSKKTAAIALSSYTAAKRLILTATPFVNDVTDLIPLINMVYGKTIVCKTRSGKVKHVIQRSVDGKLSSETISSLKKLLKDKIDFVTIGKQNKDFPSRREYRIRVPMSMDFYKKYKALLESKEVNSLFFENPKRFYNGYRQLVNSVGSDSGTNYYSMKIEKVKPIINKGKTILYTNWVNFGVVPVSIALENMGIKYKIISGSISQKERIQSVKDFNDNKLQVLILTKAGGEGLDLKEVRNVIIVDPPWNPAGLEQIIGRAIRYKSHVNLPESQRVVDIYFMELRVPKSMEGNTDVFSGDRVLYKIVKRKMGLREKLRKFFKKLQIK